jgi:putative FmdB family regulatory protein
MPFYKYHCEKCDKPVTIERKISEYNPHELCPECNTPMKRDMKDMCGVYVCNTTGFYGKNSK